MPNLWQQLNGDLSAIVENVRRSLVQISNGRGAGAGTIWHADGLIVTNAHVVAGRHALKVILPDGRSLPARILAADANQDLAALSIEANNLPTITLGDSKQLQPGEWVVALGHPWGVLGAATAGIVIATGMPPEMPAHRGEFIQVGLHLRPGHSGGPLVDVQGRLIGLNAMITGPDVGLAVPVHRVKSFLRQALGTASPAVSEPTLVFI
jgi:S1-C subfamily serine protease